MLSKKKKKDLHKNFLGDLKKKKKKKSSQKFFKRSPQKNVFQKNFQALHKILTIQKIVLSSSRGQANFRGLEAKAKDLTFEAKDFKMCPRGLHLWFIHFYHHPRFLLGSGSLANSSSQPWLDYLQFVDYDRL